MKRLACSVLLTVILQLSAVSQTKSPSNADEKAIWAEAAAWSKAMEAKDAATFVTFYAEEARVLPPNAPAISGRAALLDYWKKFMALPGLKGSFGPDKVVVAKSRDIAYETGTYSMTTNDAQGKPQHEKGKYLVVWKKDSSGKWKVVADMFSADQ
jgi:ketosteroid isomerase-like protein